MEQSDTAAQQMIATFQGLASLLDPNLKLSDNPGATKRLRRQHLLPGPNDDDSKPKQQLDTSKVMMLMAKMMLRMDRDMQMLHKETTFLFFFCSKESSGVLPQLVKAATAWHEQAQMGSSSSMTPLRQTLMQQLMQELINRIEKLAAAPDNSPLHQVALKNQIILADRTVPYMQWDHQTQALKVSTKTPLSLAKLGQNCVELLDHLKDPTLVMRFHSLPTKEGSLVTPWRLQLSARDDHPYSMLLHLCQSQVWALVAASMKQHNLHQSNLASALEHSLGMTPTKGKGKGKSKTKNKVPLQSKIEQTEK